MKKLLTDILCFIIFAPVLFLIFVICYCILFLFEKRPIIMKQERIGYRNKPFLIYKFRTMAPGSTDKYSTKINDPRVTRIGRFLRKHYIDELPQIINVLKGEMVIIGPRPERPVYVKQFEKSITGYNKRHSIMPGITGWQQTNLSYGFEKTIEKQKLDLYYIENRSNRLNLKIILKTFGYILSGKGRY